jgi:hypothetical protein
MYFRIATLDVETGSPTSYTIFSGDYDTLVSTGQIEIVRAAMYNYFVFVLNMSITSDITLWKGLLIKDLNSFYLICLYL